ncbi:hypothetical protein MES5069_760032 [Mesorhizobium escarrei]|uniref:Uncharacterized protein n=1 Tax=Mesorhizobium escarrei TaxID=666018 RepID=A0ABM9EJT9_9HYPH|nr:hypothetical protein MES5069_760032 [Mesorhizobium escarrei]
MQVHGVMPSLWIGQSGRGLRGIHRSGVPFDEAGLSTAADHGQLDLWPNECEGMGSV